MVKTVAGVTEQSTLSEAEGSSAMSTGTYQELAAQLQSMSQQLNRLCLERIEVQPVSEECVPPGHYILGNCVAPDIIS